MQGKISKIKDNNGQYKYPVTVSDAVFVEPNKTLTTKLSEMSGGGSVEVTAVNSDVATRKPVVSFMFDDTAIVNYNTLSDWTSRGVAYTTGFRQDFIGAAGGGLTFDMLREMQNAGIEIAYHGMTHNYTGKSDYVTDIPTYLDIAKTEGLNIHGFIGPNGDYYEDVVFHNHFDTFKWARGGGASNGVANVRVPVDYFKFITSSFIDDLTSEAALTTLKTKIDVLTTRGTGVLTLSAHMNTSITPYIPALLDYILASGIEIMTVSQAYETYGALWEFYDSNLILGSDFTKRGSGNGGTSINPASPHFILMKDGTVVSNTTAMKMITPKYRNVAINGNTLPDSFDVGVSVIQYGSADDRAGFPNIGTLYNFNLGKDNGQQFQLYKCHNKGGIYYREANTDNTWKTGMVNKLGIFRSTVPNATNATGFQGDFSADANYVYICYADNSWIRVPKDSTWTTTV